MANVYRQNSQKNHVNHIVENVTCQGEGFDQTACELLKVCTMLQVIETKRGYAEKYLGHIFYNSWNYIEFPFFITAVI